MLRRVRGMRQAGDVQSKNDRLKVDGFEGAENSIGGEGFLPG